MYRSMIKPFLVYGLEASSSFVAPFLWHVSKKQEHQTVEKLRQTVENKRVLVLGSGPSANNLKRIPKDMIVLGCNFSPALLPNDQEVHGLLTTSFAVKDSPEIQSVLETREFQWLASNKPRLIPSQHKACSRKAKYIQIFGDLIDLKPLLNKRMGLFKNGQWYFFSSGVQLILLALAAGAREVYVSGIDTSREVIYAQGRSYKKDSAYKKNQHLHADLHALHEIAQNNYPVYSLHQESPLSTILVNKSWQD